MCPDDRFLQQGKQILPEICQVRPMLYIMQSSYDFQLNCLDHFNFLLLIKPPHQLSLTRASRAVHSLNFETKKQRRLS